MSKNFDANKPDNLQNIKDHLWKSIDVVRGKLDPNEYSVVLYLLTLVNEGLLDETALKTVSNAEDIQYLVAKYLGGNELELKLIFQAYESALEKLGKQIADVLAIFQNVDRNLLDKHYREIFEFMLYKLSKANGKYAGEAVQPKELTEFIGILADLRQNSNVYNPFAGFCSFRLALPEGTVYQAQEINQQTWAIGYLRLLANGYGNEALFSNKDSISHWGTSLDIPKINALDFPSEAFKHDLVIASPPFNLRLPNKVGGRFGLINTVEHFFIEKGLDVLRHNGKLIGVLPSGFLFRAGAEHGLRKYLVENDLISTIISLPGGLLFHTAIPIIIFVIDKNKEHKGNIRFVNGSDFVVDTKQRNKVLDYKRLLQVMETSENSEFVRFIQNKLIVSEDYNLSVLRYFKHNYEGVKLRNVLTRLRGTRHNSGEAVHKVVRIKDLNTEQFDFDLKLDYEVSNYKFTGAETLIQESCLLVASLGEKLKPTYFNYVDKPIILHQNVMAFKIDDTEINKEYLIGELNSQMIADQMRSLFIGSGILKLKVEDFLSMMIELPSLEEQKGKIKGFKEEYIRNKEKELLFEREIFGLKDDAFREFASIKHTFRQYLNALKSNVSGTRKFIGNNIEESITVNTIYSKNLNRTLGDHLLSLEGTIDSMSKLLLNFESHEFIFEPEENNLISLIEEAQNRFANPNIFEFGKLLIDFKSFEQFDGEQILPLANIHPEDFFRVFSNIISNAIEHGFKNKEGNMIRTSIAFDAENLFLTLEISNNGWAMDDNFTLKHLTTRGEKSANSAGTGVGGADIKSILKRYDGRLDIINDKDKEFPVVYVIDFPIVTFQL